MNPSNNETGLQLPAPVEAPPLPNGQPAGAEAGLVGAAALNGPGAPERAPGGPEASTGQPAVPSTGLVSLPLPLPPQMQAGPLHTAAQPVQSSVPSNLPAADDGDLIEKEWVDRAKQVVARTKDDPYKQSEELTGIKVDYIKKRYGKTIKLK